MTRDTTKTSGCVDVSSCAAYLTGERYETIVLLHASRMPTSYVSLNVSAAVSIRHNLYCQDQPTKRLTPALSQPAEDGS
jgi:hypothetical protein